MSQNRPQAAQGSSLIRHPLQGRAEAQSLVRPLAEALGLLTMALGLLITALWLLYVMTVLGWEETEVWEKNNGGKDLHRGAGRSVGRAGLVAAGLAPACPCMQQLPAHLLWTRSSLALSGLLPPGILAGFFHESCHLLLHQHDHCHCLLRMVI